MPESILHIQNVFHSRIKQLVARYDQAQLWLPVKASSTGHTQGTVGDSSVSITLQGHDSTLSGSRNPSNYVRNQCPCATLKTDFNVF